MTKPIYSPIYVASRASLPERGQMWRTFREQGVAIISTWIDEDGEGQTESFSDLWIRIANEVSQAEKIVLYAETGDFPLKGALIEVGIALGMKKPVVVCLPGVDVAARSCRPIGSWIKHPLVTRIDNVAEALRFQPESQIILDADKCAHDQFQIHCQVDRIDDVNPRVYYANMRIVCTECETPFHFIGVPYGLSPNEPRLEIGGLEARMPIGLGRLPLEAFGSASYELAKAVVRK